MLATVDDDKIYDIVKDQISRWQSLVAILAIPSNIAYLKRKRWAKGLGPVSKWLVRHQDVGGVTESRWQLMYQTREKVTISEEDLTDDIAYLPPNLTDGT